METLYNVLGPHIAEQLQDHISSCLHSSGEEHYVVTRFSVTTKIVGGTYLYGTEFWGPFLMMDTNGEGSRLNADYLKWIHGFSREKTRLERCFGWVPVRSLDDKAVAACVCAGI